MHRMNARRTIPLPMFVAQLFSRFPKTAFVCLQGQTTPDDDAILDQCPNVAPPPGQLADWLDTMLYMKDVQLVISVDTALAHLAGTEGVPTWLLLPAAPDYRWMAQGDRSPWYPSMRLFRQQRLGEWGPVLDRVSDELRGLL